MGIVVHDPTAGGDPIEYHHIWFIEVNPIFAVVGVALGFVAAVFLVWRLGTWLRSQREAKGGGE